MGWTRSAIVAGVVEIVSVAVPAAVLVMVTGLVDPKLKVGGYSVPAGLEVTTAVRATLPVKPPAGVTVIEDVFPEVAPFAIVTAVPLIVKLELTAVVTVTKAVPDASL